MKKYIFSILLYALLYPLNAALAMDEAYEEDIQASKRKFLISDGKLAEERIRENIGVMTLCFKAVEGRWVSYDHAALVVEFFENKSPDISLRMLHYGREGVCCECIPSGREQIYIDGPHNTLRKVYREKRTLTEKGVEQVPPSYLRYASWILPNEQLKNAIRSAEKEAKNVKLGSPSEYYNCIKFAARVMRDAGLKEVELGVLSKVLLGYWGFGWSLKSLVDKNVTPKPDYTQQNMPKLAWKD